MADRTKLTQRFVDGIKADPHDWSDSWYMDLEVPGFGVRVRHGKKTYAIRWRDPATGKHRKKTLFECSVGTVQQAREAAAEIRRQVKLGEDPTATVKLQQAATTTVASLGEEVLQHLTARGRSSTYLYDWKRYLRLHISPAIGDRPVQDVTSHDIDKLIHGLADKPRTANMTRSILSRMFTLAERWGYVERNPVRGTERYREHARERYLTDDELARLLAALDEARDKRSADVIRLLALTGARPKELFQSQWSEFDLEAGVWSKPSKSTKTGNGHTVPLHGDAVAILRARKGQPGAARSPYVFPSRASKTGHLTSVKKLWDLTCQRAGVEDANLYDLRKAFATRLMGSGADLKTVMSLTGHKQPGVLLKHYAQVVEQKQREALQGLFGGR